MASRKRPEHVGPPQFFYNDDEARKYTSNSRMIEIQLKMSERALELLGLPEDTACHLLDIGCGSGLSGETLDENGHTWVGIDISQSMLNIAKQREVEGDVSIGDIGQGLPFRPGSFDGAISVSALQWLCNADEKSHNPVKRLFKLFSSLYACLSRGSKAVFQFYPENPQQIELITRQAMKAGFTGGVIVDYPNSTKAKKMFLLLFTGGSQALPEALGTEEAIQSNKISFSDRRDMIKHVRGKSVKKTVTWIKSKKERQRKQGKDVKADSKYTGRKRPGHF
ncbi:putative 18S rRNA (guanine-N(7))-methyltransferase [Nymphon striatum]|nr:putative 18S rRNA (guanine-N(7))-methyltransferase [Nymphon striatum]